MKHSTHAKRLPLFALTLCCGLLAFSGATLNVRAQNSGGGRDPFTKYKPPVKRVPPKSAPPVVVAPPTIQERIEHYKAQKAAARNAQMPAPKATTAMLLSELQVTGIFHTPRGYAAMVEATPIKFNYVIYPGEVFYDGQLVAIEENRLVFRRETRWSNGRREMAVETKPLRKLDEVSDSLATTREKGAAASSTKASAAESNKAKEEKASPQPDKP